MVRRGTSTSSCFSGVNFLKSSGRTTGFVGDFVTVKGLGGGVPVLGPVKGIGGRETARETFIVTASSGVR